MTATIGTLQKSVESHYEALSPIEKALDSPPQVHTRLIIPPPCQVRDRDHDNVEANCRKSSFVVRIKRAKLAIKTV